LNITRNHTGRRYYNWLGYRIIEQFLQEHIPFYKGVFIDLGCGEAPYKDFFKKYIDRYIGVDWSESYHNTKADIIADLNKPLPFKSDVADTVISISVLEHLCEPQQMLNEAYRILKTGGCFILQVPWQWWVHEAPYDYFRYTPYGLRYMLEKAGFVDVNVAPTSGFFSMFILKFNYFSVHSIRGPKILRWLIKALLIPLWYAGQWFAPFLDVIDKNWLLESAGYSTVAKKL